MSDNQSLVCGLDVSTSVVGIAILTLEGELVELRSIDLRRVQGGIWRKIDCVKQELRSFREETLGANCPDSSRVQHIFVEQNLAKFRPGMSSAQTIVLLARFNGIVSLIARDIFGIDPEYVGFSKARKALGISVQSKKKCGIDTKIQLWNQVSKMIDWDWKYKVLKSGPRKGQRVLCETCYDEVDAYITAKAGLMGVGAK